MAAVEPDRPEDTEVPPVSKPWNTTSLAIGGAMLIGRVPPPNLTGPVHPLFTRDRWEIADDDYTLLLPSMRLATRLLEVGMPYIASFLPSSRIFNSPQDVSHAEHSGRSRCPQVIPLRKKVLLKDLQVAAMELQAMAKSIKWRLNERMHAEYRWNGITRLVDDKGADFHVLDQNEVRESDLQAGQAGQVRRPLVIALMDLFLVPMRTQPVDSEIRLKAQFMAAITMVHELGHAIFHQDYRSFNTGGQGEFGEEPYIGNDADRELGRSFICWIFNGVHPQFCESHKKDAQFGSLGWSLYWEPLHKIDEILDPKDKEHKRPLYEKLNAIPVQYLSTKFQQGWWEAHKRGVPLQRLAAFLRMSLNLDTVDKLGAATAVKANWWMEPLAKRPRWKGNYRIIKFSSGQPVEEGISYAQAVSQMKLDGQNFSFALHDDEDDYDEDDIDQLSSEPTPPEDKVVLPGHDDRTIIALSVETHDDGMLDEDIGFIEDDYSEVVTRIEVRYRPTADFQPRSTELIPPEELVEQARREVGDEIDAEKKAEAAEMFAGPGRRSGKRGASSDSLFIHGPSKRLRTIVEAGRVDANATLREKVIKRLSQATANEVGHWTRIQAWYYCSENGLLLPELPRTAAAQQAKLDNGTEAGYQVMRKIQYHLLETLWSEISKEGAKAEVLIAQQILSLIDFFLDEDIDNLMKQVGRNDEQNITRKKKICKEYFTNAMANALERTGDSSSQKDQLDPLHALAPDPSQWSEDDLRSWCRDKGIPQWGSISGLIARVNRFREEEKTVKVGIAGRPKPPPGRTDRTGTEVYYFSAVLRHSSLDALKSSLFIAGQFPSDTELDLWVNGNENLKPGPLSKQSPKVDWTRLILRATRTAIPKQPVPLSRQERISRINTHNTLIEDRLREAQREPEVEVQRDFTVKLNYPPGSVLNKMTDISQRALALSRIRNAPGTMAGQSYQKHDQPNLIKGQHLEDMIMDLEDLEKRKEQKLRKPLTPAQVAEERALVAEERDKIERRTTHMKALGDRFTKVYGIGERLGVGEEEVERVVKEEVEDWQEDYV
ncbi:hypothetical protein NHQ30_006380 [Ciborinia camelliae]|nr:hypothetical protein NHQ30_006380 [Ciborinia camelliae]